ncbi:MAG: hypothetical protein V7K97_22755 [Nostoc sp.]|uniref:hypothetical protein n=1 Tax=Nostoc sp. TaxID=1180 RepID=UPI002FFC0BBA
MSLKTQFAAILLESAFQGTGVVGGFRVQYKRSRSSAPKRGLKPLFFRQLTKVFDLLTVDYSTIACNFDTPQEDSTKVIKSDDLVGKFITKYHHNRICNLSGSTFSYS